MVTKNEPQISLEEVLRFSYSIDSWEIEEDSDSKYDSGGKGDYERDWWWSIDNNWRKIYGSKKNLYISAWKNVCTHGGDAVTPYAPRKEETYHIKLYNHPETQLFYKVYDANSKEGRQVGNLVKKVFDADKHTKERAEKIAKMEEEKEYLQKVKEAKKLMRGK